jgi:hypothetical protein
MPTPEAIIAQDVVFCFRRELTYSRVYLWDNLRAMYMWVVCKHCLQNLVYNETCHKFP